MPTLYGRRMSLPYDFNMRRQALETLTVPLWGESTGHRWIGATMFAFIISLQKAIIGSGNGLVLRFQMKRSMMTQNNDAQT